MNNILTTDSGIHVAPFYQPVVDAFSKQISGCEVQFQNIMRKNNRIKCTSEHLMMEEWVGLFLSDIAMDFKTLEDIYHVDEVRFLNIPVEMSFIMSAGFLDNVSMVVSAFRKNKVTLVFEVSTDKNFILSSHASEIFRGLIGLGVLFTVRDSGYDEGSSVLAYICRACFIKVDSGLYECDKPGEKEQRMDKIVQLARRTGARIIASGIKTTVQEAWFVSRGADFLQGSRYGVPMPFNLFHYRVRLGSTCTE